jgi:type IV secretory pathway VirJ component
VAQVVVNLADRVLADTEHRRHFQSVLVSQSQSVQVAQIQAQDHRRLELKAAIQYFHRSLQQVGRKADSVMASRADQEAAAVTDFFQVVQEMKAVILQSKVLMAAQVVKQQETHLQVAAAADHQQSDQRHR